MGLNKLLLCAAILSLALVIGFGCAKAPAPHPMIDVLPGELFSFSSGENGTRVFALSMKDFAQRARDARYILVGEGHGSACDHNVQADIIRALAEADANPVIGLEMAAVDKQDVLDEFNSGELPLSGLKEALKWSENWGHFYELYEPIFKLARDLELPLAALNVPKDVVEAVRQGGLKAVTPKDKNFLPSELVPPVPAQHDALMEELERHQKMREGHAERDRNATAEDRTPFNVENFLLIQSLWDSKMAESAVKTYGKYKRPVVILAGSGHVEHGWGIAARLNAFDPEGRVLSVAPWRGEKGLDLTASDVFFYCPVSHRSRLGFSMEFLDQEAVVIEVEEGSKASTAGVRENDVILTAQGLPVTDLWVLHKAAIQAKRENSPLEITVLRRGKGVILLIEMSTAGEDAKEDADAGTP